MEGEEKGLSLLEGLAIQRKRKKEKGIPGFHRKLIVPSP